MILNRELIAKLGELPPDAEIDLEVQGYEYDSVALVVGEDTVLAHDYGLNELHFVNAPPIKGEIL